jgi:diguanylate cyclase
MKAIFPENEKVRIETLNSLNLLDSDPEDFFDRITRIAAKVLDVPIALVSLVDTDRQWFKSKFGIEATQTHRDFAFCAHAILTDEPLIVENATEDQRFSDNPLVTSDPNIRFYIGIPVKSMMGYSIGTLCAIDDKPRKLSKSQIDILKDLSLLVSQEIQHRENITNSLKVAKRSESKFQSIFENAAIGIALVTPTGGWMQVNDDLCKIVGYSREELVNLTFQDITHPEDLDKDLNLLNQLVKGKINRYEIEKRYIRKDGSILWIELHVTKQLDVNGDLEYFISIVKNIQAAKESEASLLSLKKTLEERVIERTEELSQTNLSLSHALAKRIESEQNLKNSELELRMVIEHANDAYVCMNSDGLVTSWNRQAENIFGWSEEEALGKRLDKLVIPENMREAHREGMKRYLKSKQSNMMGKRIELEAMTKLGQLIPVELQINSLEINGQLIFSSFLRDITDRKKLDKILQDEARNDLLTGLPNRRKFEELLPMSLARANRNKHSIGLLFIDLDGFKSINDTYGHDSGDMVLREVANRLDKSIRSTDTVARLSGDEFVIILDVIKNEVEDAGLVATKILKSLIAPIQMRTDLVSISASIGIALYEGSEAKSIDPVDMIKTADTAMYTAKRLGKNQYFISASKFINH